MTESSSPDITPKEEPVTLNKPESPNLFLHATQVEFTFDEITFTTNNEVALIYPSHPNQEYFMAVSDFISKCCLKEAFTRALTQYQEYLREFWYTTKTLEDSKVWVSTPTGGVRGEIGITTFRNAIRAHYLPHSSGKTGGLDQISNKDATILYCLATGVQVDYAKIIWDDLIHKLNKKTREKIVPYPSVHNWILKPNQPEEPLFTDHMKAICNLDVLVDSKATKYSSPNEEVPQGKKPGAKSRLRRKQSLKHTSEYTTEASKSQSGHSKKETKSSSAMDTSPSHPSPPTPVVKKSEADEISKKIKLEDLSDLLKDTRYAFFTPDSPIDEPIIVSDESKEDDVEEAEQPLATSQDVPKDTSVPHPPSQRSAQIQELMAQAKPSYPDINQLTTLLVTSLKPELAKLLASHDFASCLPIELKELPSKITKLSISKKVTNTLNRFATLVENTSGATNTSVPSADKATASPAEGEKDADTNLKNELVDLLGIYIVTQYYNKKLLYEKYCEKMKKRRQSSKIINCDVLTKKGPISLKVYREDGTAEFIEKFKASNLQLAKSREAVQACLDRKEKGWKTIYELIKTRMEYLKQTEKELHIDFNKSLQEQDPLDELNDIANKKRKRTGDSTDHSRSSKKHKSSSSTYRRDAEVPSALALQVLRRLGSIFTSVYVVKVYKARKRLLYAKRNKAISLGKGASKVSIEVRIKQKSQENGQNQTNTNTGTEEHAKSREEATKSQTLVKLQSTWSTKVKFDELTAIASEHDYLEPELQRFNNQNSSDDLMNTPSKEDLDNLFGPMFEDYFEQKSSDTTINSAAQPTHDQEDLPSTSSIIDDTHEAPLVITTSVE
ncbi:hypothetical protein Tco_1446862 [Tanacetum coccineum]